MAFGFGSGFFKVNTAAATAAASTAYFAAVPDAFTPERQVIINELIAGLITDGNFSKLDRFWILANTTSGNALIDIIGLNVATLVNAPAFVADQGYTSNGTTSYIDSNYNTSGSAVNLSINSNCIGVYSRTNNNTAGSVDFGALNGIGPSYLTIGARNGANMVTLNNDATTSTTAVADSLGMSSQKRINIFTYYVYKNGVETATKSVSSVNTQTQNLYMLCRNGNGIADAFSTRQLSVAYIGSGTVNQSALYTRVQTYMTSLGTQV